MAREKSVAHFRPWRSLAGPFHAVDYRPINGRIWIGRAQGRLVEITVDQGGCVVLRRHVSHVRQGLQLGGPFVVQVNVETSGHGRRIPPMADGVKAYRFNSVGSPPWAVMLTLSARSTA
jgi:hypothetical protein